MITLKDVDKRLPPPPKDDEQAKPSSLPAFSLADGGQGRFLVGDQDIDIAELIGPADADDTRYILSEGQWSLHEVIAYLFSITGTAQLTITSWGLTEKPLQQVLDLVHQGIALEPVILLDYRVKLQSAKAYQLLLASGLDIRMTDNHSKVVVLTNERFGIAVFTSANLTRNPRLEFYVVTKRREVAIACREQVRKIHARSQPL